MVGTTDQIETHIETTREHLGANLDALERKIKSATDWRAYFQSSPGVLLGAAFAGGVALAIAAVPVAISERLAGRRSSLGRALAPCPRARTGRKWRPWSTTSRARWSALRRRRSRISSRRSCPDSRRSSNDEREPLRWAPAHLRPPLIEAWANAYDSRRRARHASPVDGAERTGFDGTAPTDSTSLLSGD